MLTAPELFDIVSTYSSFGDHHTGTAADHDTTSWLAASLRDMGAEAATQPYEFTRWVGTTDLRLADGTQVPHVPVFYSACGALSTTSLEVVEVDRGISGGATGLDGFLEGVCEADALVFALNGPPDLPVQCNRVPELRDGPPAVIIAGNWADRVDDTTRLDFDAKTVPGQSANLVARLGKRGAAPVTITTPLTGWTPCAGERGTGLAVALALLEDLAADHFVTFVAASCHELDHLGLDRWLATNDVSDTRVIHLGSSVATVGPDGELHERQTLTTATGDKRAAIEQIASEAKWRLDDRRVWVGEGTNWRAAGADVLSFLGTSALFHTTGDLPAVATNAAALETASATVRAATRRFLRAS